MTKLIKHTKENELLGTPDHNRAGNFLKRRSLSLIAGGAVLTTAGLIAGTSGTGTQLASSTIAAPTVQAATTVAPYAAANQAAITWATANASGSGSVSITKTEAETIGSINTPVYEVSLVAPNGKAYVIDVQISNSAILAANLAETQSATQPSTVPPTTMPFGGVPAADQTAIAWAKANASGTGTVISLKTKADVDGPAHTAVFDVSLIAANGKAYTVAVQMSNDAVISAKLTDSQTADVKPVEHSEASSSPKAKTQNVSASSEQNKTQSSSMNQGKHFGSSVENKTSVSNR